MIATKLGPERTRVELLPFLNELLEDPEEVVIALCDSLSNMLDYIGGPSKACAILSVLENICTNEEIAIREKVSLRPFS